MLLTVACGYRYLNVMAIYLGCAMCKPDIVEAKETMQHEYPTGEGTQEEHPLAVGLQSWADLIRYSGVFDKSVRVGLELQENPERPMVKCRLKCFGSMDPFKESKFQLHLDISSELV